MFCVRYLFSPSDILLLTFFDISTIQIHIYCCFKGLYISKIYVYLTVFTSNTNLVYTLFWTLQAGLHISCNLLTDYISNIFTTTQTDKYISSFIASSVYTLQYCACPTIIQYCALLYCITLRYFLFCHISNFSYFKELDTSIV